MNGILEILGVFLLSTVKFLFAPAAAIGLGLGYKQAILLTSLGGSTGVFFFYFIEYWLVHVITIFWRRKHPVKKKKKRIFTRRNRMIVNIKNKWGLIGLALLTPGIISIPVGTLIAAKYFKNRYRTLTYLIISVCLWSIGLTTFFYFVNEKME